MRRSSSRPAASIAPVFPAETTASAVALGTARTAATSELSGFARTASAGLSSISIRSCVSTSSSPRVSRPGGAEEHRRRSPSLRAASAPATISAGPRSPPIASTAMRVTALRGVEAERLDLAALVRAAGRADVVRPLRLPALRADVHARRLIACVARRLSRRDFEVFRFGTAMTGGHYSHNRVPMVPERAPPRCFDDQLRRRVVDEQRSSSGTAGAPSSGRRRPATSTRLVGRMRELPGHVEWKLYGHDGPADLDDRLRAAGLVPDEEETVLVAEAASLPEPDADVASPTRRSSSTRSRAGARLRPPQRGPGASCCARSSRTSRRCSPSSLRRRRAGVGRAGRLRESADFAGLFGGATLPEYRGRGLYRATVAARARLARERGYRYLYVDALPTSRPILERLGFVRLTTTTPFSLPGRRS